MSPRRLPCLALLAALVALAAAPAEAQRGRRSRFTEPGENPPYDGRVTFVRLRYEVGMSQDFGRFGGGDIPWSHDYPRGERNFTQILGELTTIRVRTAESVVMRVNDPQLAKYPLAYMAEPGFWHPNDAEVAGFRAYLRKGGMVMFDDFRGNHWYNLEAQMRRVLPELRFIRIDGTHPVFDAFYRVPHPEELSSYGDQPPSFWAIFEDNDPRKRMIALAYRDGDLSEYWEYSGQGFAPVDLENEAYKLGINFLVYSLSR
jgi:hypothetical protein